MPALLTPKTNVNIWFLTGRLYFLVRNLWFPLVSLNVSKNNPKIAKQPVILLTYIRIGHGRLAKKKKTYLISGVESIFIF